MAKEPTHNPDKNSASDHEKVSFRRRDIVRKNSFPSTSPYAPRLYTRYARPKIGWLRRTIGLVCFVTLCSIALGYVLLRQGVSSQPLTSHIMAQISDRLGPDFDVAAEKGRITLQNNQIAIRFEDMRITQQQQPFADLTAIGFALSAKDLIKRQVKVDKIFVQGLSLKAQAKQPNINLSDRPDILATNITLGLNQVLAAILQTQLDEINLSDLTLNGTTNIDALSFKKTGADEYIIFGDMDFAGQSLPIDGMVAKRDNTAEVIVDIKNFDISSLLNKPGAECVGKVDVSMHAQPLESASRIQFGLNMRNGICQHPKAGPLAIAGQGKVSIRSDKTFYAVDRLNIEAGKTQLVFDGGFEAELIEFDGNIEKAVRFELISDASTAHSDESQESPVRFAAKLGGVFRPSNRVMDIAEIGVRTVGGGQINGQALLSFEQQGAPAVFLSLVADNMPVAHAKQLWPYMAAVGGRKWAHRALFSGIVENAKLEMSVPAGRLGNGIPLYADEISGEATITNTRFDLVKELPAVRDASIEVQFEGPNVIAILSKGNAYLKDQRQIVLNRASFKLDNAHLKPAIATVTAEATGNASALLDFASRDPINLTKRLKIDPNDLDGNADVKVDLRFPVNPEGPRPAPVFSSQIDFNNVAIKTLVAGRVFSKLKGRLDIDAGVANITAQGLMDGLPTSLKLVEPFVPDSKVTRKRDIKLTLDSKAIAKLSPELAKYLTGSIIADVQQTANGATIDADLTNAVIQLNALGISKPKGRAARAQFDMIKTSSETRITNLVLGGQSLSANGTVVLTKNGLQSANLKEVEFPGASGFSVIVKNTRGSLDIVLNGQSYDARMLLKRFVNLENQNSGSKLQNMRIQAQVSSILGQNDERLTDAKLAFLSQNGKSDVDIRGTLINGKTAKLIKNDIGDDKSLLIETADAGRLLRFADTYKKMTGGTLSVNLKSNGKGVFQGPVTLLDFSVVDEPRLNTLMSSGGNRSLNNITQNKLKTNRIRFRRASGDVQYAKSFLVVRDGLIGGQEVGFTIDGRVYDSNRSMNLTGTFLPAYGLNRLIGGIPLLGQLFGSGEKRGLIGITFKLEGDYRTPNIYVNPLSLVAPGVFREIFRF